MPPIDIEELTTSLTDQGVIPKKLSKMKRQKKPSDPTEESFATYYLAVTLEADASSIFKIKHLCGLRVKWQKYKNPKQVTQYNNCQRLAMPPPIAI